MAHILTSNAAAPARRKYLQDKELGTALDFGIVPTSTTAMPPSILVTPEGLEPPTYRVETCRSSPLSYGVISSLYLIANRAAIR